MKDLDIALKVLVGNIMAYIIILVLVIGFYR